MNKSRKFFPVDKSAFSEEETAKATASKRKKKTLTMEQLIQAAKDLGVTIHIPTNSMEERAQEDSLDKLGFVDSSSVKKRAKVREIVPTTLEGNLNFTHNINGTLYGPGKITLSYLEKDLFCSLIRQDAMASQALRDTSEYLSQGRAFIIEEGQGRDTHNKFIKREVPAELLSTIMARHQGISIKQDIAGYNSNRQSYF